jgi:hypothetical protein
MPFEHWLLENFGFEADMTPIKHTPPGFVRSDGFFDVKGYEQWREQKRVQWASERKVS